MFNKAVYPIWMKHTLIWTLLLSINLYMHIKLCAAFEVKPSFIEVEEFDQVFAIATRNVPNLCLYFLNNSIQYHILDDLGYT